MRVLLAGFLRAANKAQVYFLRSSFIGVPAVAFTRAVSKASFLVTRLKLQPALFLLASLFNLVAKGCVKGSD